LAFKREISREETHAISPHCTSHSLKEISYTETHTHTTLSKKGKLKKKRN